MSSVPPDIRPDISDEIDSFSGLEILPMTDELAIMPFERYGVWWFDELDHEMAFVKTHGPYADYEMCVTRGMNLVE